MSDAEVVSADPTEVKQDPQGETAFIVIKNFDGSWTAATDITMPLVVTRAAGRHEIREGCNEIANLVTVQEIATLVMRALPQKTFAE